MYFEGIKKFEIKKFIKDPENIYAHINNNDEFSDLDKSTDTHKNENISKMETLEEHLDKSLKYLFKVFQCKKLYKVFIKFEKMLCKDFNQHEITLFREMLLNVIYMHDIGKINICFQRNKMKNKYWKNDKAIGINNSKHSCLSALIYMDYFYKKIKEDENLTNKKNKKKLKVFMILNAYIISKHHGGLDKIENFKNKLLDSDEEGNRLCNRELCIFEDIYKETIKFSQNDNILKNLFKNFEINMEQYEEEEKNISIVYYIYERLLLSILVSCDYYSTSEFKNGCEIKDFGEIENIERFYDEFNKTNIVKNTREYESKEYGKINNFSNINDINILRKEMFLDAEKELLNNLDKNIFYLEAPTGSGKSNVAFNLTFKLIEKNKDLNKLVYVYPFNTLVEQNIRTIGNIFTDKEILNDVAVINSIVPIKERKLKDEEEPNYNKSVLDRQFLHYPMILTTHVSLFNYLFGTSKEDIFPLAQLCNSVIVLDEIQSYNNYIWKEIIMFLNYYSEILNIKFIIMSATLPNLDILIDTESHTTNLILNREKYFNHKLFKERVKLDYSLVDEEKNNKEEYLENLLNHIVKTSNESNKNILVEFISKVTANEFYEMLVEYKDINGLGHNDKREVELITGDDNIVDRNNIINKITKEKKKNIILVATQVIEAGVDIDMDIGYKDISILDCDEQFLGRINRSALKKEKGIVYFFNIDSAAEIYRHDYRKNGDWTLNSQKYNTRQWLENKEFNKFYEQVLKKINEKGNKISEGGIKYFIKKYVNKLDYIEVRDKMKLIDDDELQCKVFFDRDILLDSGEILSGKNVWNAYINLLKDNVLTYSEKKVKLSKILSQMNYFIYKVRKNDFNYNEKLGEIYYIEDGEQYFENGKFNRKRFNEGLFC
ncbi:CRISPR-associated helicase/endonuclease Cas3 [Clostridiaceae bacterium 14S0207]|nr:CRISPR-associated helicase/endonuclease Cas3 [Clostridiaceae bacterium 14S0207]